MIESDLNQQQKDALAKIREVFRKDVASWSDLYSFLHSRAELFHAHPLPQTMLNALYTHRAFVMALQDMPDEGDACAIIDRMAFIMLFQSKRLGAHLQPGTEDSPNINVVVIDKEALAEMRKEMEEMVPSAPVVDPNKRHLH
jgi:hypothetical protein